MADLGFDFIDEEQIIEEQTNEELIEETTNDISTLMNNTLIEAIATELPQDDFDDELLQDENMTPLQRVYAYKENDALMNRLYLAKELPNALEDISIDKALEDILPVMNKLSNDVDDTVRETFASELEQLLLYFYNNSPETFYSKESFSPLLIRLLLDQSSGVASLGQQAIVTVINQINNEKLIHKEIFKGVIEGLLAIIDNKQQAATNQNHRVSIDEGGRRRSSTPGFETFARQDEDVDEGELCLAKIACISLISSMARVLDIEKCLTIALPIIEQFSGDPLFYVRKEAASCIGSLAMVVDSTIAEERLLPLFKQFSQDQIWHVRRSCVLVLPSLCGILNEPIKTELTISSVELFKNDVSRNVRNALVDIVGEWISKFLPDDWETTRQPGKLPEPLLDYFLSLGNQTQNDRTFICAYNFPAVVLTAGVDYWDSHLREIYLNLTKDYQIKVRCTFAHSLYEIARIIGPERTERDLVQIFALYLMDLDDVKQGVIEHLADFLNTLAVSSRNEYIPILAEVWDGVSTNWHLRNILTEQLNPIAMLFDAARVVEFILPLVVRACEDQFAAVRESGAYVFPVILDIVKRAVDEDGESLSQVDGYGDDDENQKNYALALLSHVMERLDDFAKSEHYRDRLVFAQISKELIDAGIDASDFGSFFLSRLAPLVYDNIVNVRIVASRAIGAIYKNEPFRKKLSEIVAPSREGEETGYALDQMTYRFALDKDRDVRSFVMSFVDLEVLEKQKEKEMKAAIEQAEASIEARIAEQEDTNDEDEDTNDDDEDDDDEDDDDEDDEGSYDEDEDYDSNEEDYHSNEEEATIDIFNTEIANKDNN